MLRSIKYGLYGAVLAGLVGGTVAWTGVDKTVHLVVDGQRHNVHTTAGTVGDVVRGAGYHPDGHDLLAPDARASVHDGSTIVYKRGRLLHLNVDGTNRDVWTTAPTVAAALDELGYSTRDFTSVSRSQRLPLGVTDVSLRTPKRVTVIHDGTHEQVLTTDATVSQLLDDLGVQLGATDQVTPDASAAITPGLKIVVQRVSGKTVTMDRPLPYPTVRHDDAGMFRGQTQVVAPGANGVARVTYALVYVDGRIVGKTQIRSVTVSAPSPRVVNVGTKPAPPNTPSAPDPSPGTAQAIAQQLAAQRGWGSDQFNCLVQMWDHESGWNVHAQNPSGAYGIPQALPGSKMGSAGPDWQDNATTQITWGLNYIAGRYGTPCDAWSLWQQQGWY